MGLLSGRGHKYIFGYRYQVDEGGRTDPGRLRARAECGVDDAIVNSKDEIPPRRPPNRLVRRPTSLTGNERRDSALTPSGLNDLLRLSIWMCRAKIRPTLVPIEQWGRKQTIADPQSRTNRLEQRQ